MIKSKSFKLLTKLKALLNIYQYEESSPLIIFKEIFFSVIVLQLILECLNHRSILKGIITIQQNPLMFICNISLLATFMSLSLFIPKRHFGYLLVATTWLSLGVTNFMILSFRITPLTATDFKILSSVITIVDKYLSFIQIILIIIVLFLVIGLLIKTSFKIPRTKIRFKQSLVALVFSWLLLFTSFNIASSAHAVSRNFGNIADAFLDYGFAYSFSTSVVDNGIQEPKYYSSDKVNHVLKAIKHNPTSFNIEKATPWYFIFPKTTEISLAKNIVAQQKPNIIIIQLESFFDVKRIKAFEFNEDPLPNMTKLKENYSSGFVTVPSIGAGTVNTEFEILSGMSLDYFGAGEYPYKTILKKATVESLPYLLTDYGYYNHAIHNNMGTFYSRNTVYPNLGFDSFTSIEYMNNITYNPLHWAKDMVLVPEILKALKSTKNQDFIYTVSVQPHGKYPDEVLIENPVIIPKALSTLPLMNNQEEEDFNIEPDTNNSTNGLSTPGVDDSKKEDNSVSQETLNPLNTSAIEDSNTNDIPEPYVVNEVTYNKYLYYVNQVYETDAFVGKLIEELEDYPEPVIVVLYGDHLPSLDIEQEDLKTGTPFQMDYVIWDNMKLEKVDQDVSAYQLTSTLMKTLGIESGILNKFHQTMMHSLEYQEELELLQYDMLYGDKNVYGGESPYLPKDIQMGTDLITITRIYQKGEAIFLSGHNFTMWSEVFINEEQVDSLYIDKQTLLIPNNTIETNDIITVKQVTQNNKVLSTTDDFIFID